LADRRPPVLTAVAVAPLPVAATVVPAFAPCPSTRLAPLLPPVRVRGVDALAVTEFTPVSAAAENVPLPEPDTAEAVAALAAAAVALAALAVADEAAAD